MSKTWIHPRIQPMISGLIKHQAIGHAILLSGPPESLIQQLAKTLCIGVNCPTHCGECRPCRLIEKDQHPDLIHITPKKNITIDDIRQIRELTQYGPAELPGLMVMIHQADLLTVQAENAFLKCLEEPQANVYFILMTEQPQKLLPTIRSRCQHFECPPLDELTLNAFIKQTYDVPEQDLTAASRHLYCKGIHPREDLPSFFDLTNMPRSLRLQSVENWAKDRDLLTELTIRWIFDLWETIQNGHFDQLSKLHQLIEFRSKLTTNMNVRLQLTGMLLRLDA